MNDLAVTHHQALEVLKKQKTPKAKEETLI